MNNAGTWVWIIQSWILAVLLLFGVIAGLIVAIRNDHSLLLMFFFLILVIICLLGSVFSGYYAVRRTRELRNQKDDR